MDGVIRLAFRRGINMTHTNARPAASKLILCLLLAQRVSATAGFAADLPSKKTPPAAPAVDASLPYTLSLTYTGEPWYNKGGIKTGFDYMWGIDGNLTLDMQRLMGVPNATVYIEGFYQG